MKRNLGLNWVKVARLHYFYNTVNITWCSVFNFKVVLVEDLVNKLVLISYSQGIVLNYLFTWTWRCLQQGLTCDHVNNI